ncbi:MAG: tRNA-dihydrouridine synthase family protein [Oscillospiraceae bacterium]|nr:tRNA-dihydrouridine synthase family protein [Oscillospiraceae bacterium]
MRYYFAPLEGITDSIYRRLHHKHFPGITRYYTPFFSPTVHRNLTPREARELPPAETLSFTVIPQLLTKNTDDFLWMARQCKDLGYTEVNLNLGCPSGTVTAKGKGSGMLTDLDTLDSFLYDIFASAPLDISVKTRIGFHTKEEFPAILEVLNRYPIKELTIHPRIRSQFYNGSVDMDVFRHAAQHSAAPVCFNGNLNSLQDIAQFSQDFADIDAVMLGRGLIADPGMLSPGGTDRAVLKAFYDSLLEEYLEAFGGSRNAMFRLKENWRYLICKFDGADKLYKRLRKTTDLSEYISLCNQIFETLPLRNPVDADW